MAVYKRNEIPKDKLTFSCIVSVYNGEKYIDRCINSILGQRRNFDKIIIYDDASTDGTLMILNKMATEENSLIIIEGKLNRGPGGGKNYAAQYADTDFFMFVDADDYIEKDYLMILERVVYNCLARGEGLPDIIISDFKCVDENENVKYYRKFKEEKSALYEGITNWGKLFRNCFWIEHRLVIPEGKVLDDVLLRAYIVGCSPVVVHTSATDGYCYAKNSASVSNTYMNYFIEGVAENEMTYLFNQMKWIDEARTEEYLYWVYKIYCWHLLKSGSGVGCNSMRKECQRMYKLLNQFFPDYKKNGYLLGKKSLRYERRIVRNAVRGMFLLEKTGLQKFFLSLYSIFNLRFLWPRI